MGLNQNVLGCLLLNKEAQVAIDKLPSKQPCIKILMATRGRRRLVPILCNELVPVPRELRVIFRRSFHSKDVCVTQVLTYKDD